MDVRDGAAGRPPDGQGQVAAKCGRECHLVSGFLGSPATDLNFSNFGSIGKNVN
jgi:hypothetical protein